MEIPFRILVEAEPALAWETVFQEGWPGWRAWLRGRRAPNAPTLRASRAAMARHMPEMVPIWERLVERVDADEEAAAFLTFWCPPRFLGHCSQAVIGGSRPSLVRNYDLDPRLSERTLLHTSWTDGAVAGMVDGMIGLADGMNADGLVVSLSYGGRSVTGRGFGIPMVVRYLLETCPDVPSAVGALNRLPHHMSYNLALLDRAGAHATVFVAPDRETIVSRRHFSTNHQERIEDTVHASFCDTAGRAGRLETLFRESNPSAETLVAAFQSAPLFAQRYREGFGTVYTAHYEPTRGSVTLHWPTAGSLTHALDAPVPRERVVRYRSGGDGGAAASGYDWIGGLPPALRELIMQWWTPEIAHHGWTGPE
jgi:predicted choloylglycine hydrolase